MRIAVTGASGYLGGAVHDVLHAECVDHIAATREMMCLEATGIVHCAGRLRGRSPAEIWAGNLGATEALLRAISAETAVVMASSRAAARPDQDDYGLSKRRAEELMTVHAGPVHVIRLTVLAGPSHGSVGSSFLSRMVIAALKEGAVSVPLRTRAVDLIDVREAAPILVALATDESNSHLRLDATSGPIDLWTVAETVAGSVRSLTGARVGIRKVEWFGHQHAQPAKPGPWHDTVARLGRIGIPWETTVNDTVASLLEKTWGRRDGYIS